MGIDLEIAAAMVADSGAVLDHATLEEQRVLAQLLFDGVWVQERTL